MSTEVAAEPCELCRIGRCQPIAAPYIYWVGKQVLVLPNAPAYLCDICGQLHYDAYFLNALDILLREMENSLPGKGPSHLPLGVQPPTGLTATRSR